MLQALQWPYNDPRLLPCLHSFCQQCLHHEIEKSGSQQVLKCPTYERSTSIPVGGASVLPQNLHLGFEVEVAGYMSKIVSNSELCCDPCIDGRSGPAEVFCCTCYRFMCIPSAMNTTNVIQNCPNTIWLDWTRREPNNCRPP